MLQLLQAQPTATQPIEFGQVFRYQRAWCCSAYYLAIRRQRTLFCATSKTRDGMRRTSNI
jgi:hypothetical protein